ncbi:MAG TPA: hypothetical protein VGE59_03765 [Patescibacteria group bacterium]
MSFLSLIVGVQTASAQFLFKRPTATPPPIKLPNFLPNISIDPETIAQSILNLVVTWITLIAGIAAFVYILYGGWKYITSAGNPSEAQVAKKMIIGAIIGLLIIALAYIVLIFVRSLVCQSLGLDANCVAKVAPSP